MGGSVVVVGIDDGAMRARGSRESRWDTSITGLGGDECEAGSVVL